MFYQDVTIRSLFYTLLKKRLCHRYFPVKFATFLKAPFCRTLPGECCKSCRLVNLPPQLSTDTAL